MAMLGLQKLGIEDPRGSDRKRLVTFVEIDRCATDAVAVVTGCCLGKCALKFRDWGKVAATLLTSAATRQFRVAAKESSKVLAEKASTSAAKLRAIEKFFAEPVPERVITSGCENARRSRFSLQRLRTT